MASSAGSLRPKLPVIQFLNTHREHGGIDQRGYETLCRMVEMTSAISQEVHVMYAAKIHHAGALADMETFLNSIFEGAASFSKNIHGALDKGRQARKVLPKLDIVGVDASDDVLSYWQLKLRHQPTGNDAKLFKLVFEHFSEAGYKRLDGLHQVKPQYEVGYLDEKAKTVLDALDDLWKTAIRADDLVLELDRKFQVVMRQRGHASAVQGVLAGSSTMTLQRSPSPELLTAAVYQPPASEQRSRAPHPILSKSFSAAEEAVTRRGHARAPTATDMDYTTGDHENTSSPSAAQPPTVGITRKVSKVPRVFTGSFSQLESDIRRLQLHKVRTPEDKIVPDDGDPVKVRDFGASVASSSQSSPVHLLQRREALVERDTELQDRMIRGEVVKSRRPSTKRSRTIDDATNLQAWLDEQPPPTTTPAYPGSTERRRHFKHRENTL